MNNYKFIVAFYLLSNSLLYCANFNCTIDNGFTPTPYQRVEHAFNSDDVHLTKAMTEHHNYATTLYKGALINHMLNILSAKAYAYGHPFRREILEPLIMRYWHYLVASQDRWELANRVNSMLKSEGLMQSHLRVIAINWKCGGRPRLSPQITQIKMSENRSYFWIKFNEFRAETMEELAPKLVALMSINANILLDLQDNPGGDLCCLENLSGLFFKERTELAVIASRALIKSLFGDEKAQYNRNAVYDFSFTAGNLEGNLYAKPHPSGIAQYYDGRLAILVGPNSRSASETLAYAMQLYKKATIIGFNTFGIALASLTYPLSPSMKIQCPIGEIIFSNGVCLEGTGVCPDLDLSTMTMEDACNIWLSQ